MMLRSSLLRRRDEPFLAWSRESRIWSTPLIASQRRRWFFFGKPRHPACHSRRLVFRSMSRHPTRATTTNDLSKVTGNDCPYDAYNKNGQSVIDRFNSSGDYERQIGHTGRSLHRRRVAFRPIFRLCFWRLEIVCWLLLRSSRLGPSSLRSK